MSAELTVNIEVHTTVKTYNALRQEIEGAKTGVEELTKYVKDLKVVDETNLTQVEEVFNDTHVAITEIEKLRTAAKAPWLAGGKAVDDLAAEVLKPAKAAKETLSSKIAQARSAIARKREEALRKAAEAADKQDAELSTMHVVVAQSLAQAETKVEGYWEPEVVYPQSVPSPWWRIDIESMQDLGKKTPLDREPKAIPGVVWRKREKVRAKAVR